MTKKITIGIGHPSDTTKDFIAAWKNAEGGKVVEQEYRLNFENLETLLQALTPARWMLLKTLRIQSSMSIRTLAHTLQRDYKNVYTDVRKLENIGLIERTTDDKITVPWDIVEAHLKLAA